MHCVAEATNLSKKTDFRVTGWHSKNGTNLELVQLDFWIHIVDLFDPSSLHNAWKLGHFSNYVRESKQTWKQIADNLKKGKDFI